jgi:ATP-binding cassette, subfamily B, multidrug efflux pump
MNIKAWQDVKPILPYLRPYRRRYAWGFVALLGEVCFWVAVPQIISYAIDDIRQDINAQKLLYYAALVIGAVLCKAVFLFWVRMTLIGISRDVEYDLRNALYRHLTKLPPSYYQRNRTGDLMSRAINDLSAVRMMLGPGIMYSARTIVIMAGAVAIMTHIDARLTLACFSLTPIIVAMVVIFGRRIHERFEAIQAMMSTLSSKAQESMAGIRVLRAYAQEQADEEQFRAMNEEFVEKNRKLIRVWGMFYPALEVLLGLVIVIVLWMGGHEVARGSITIGQFFAYNFYMGQLSWPMIALGWVVNLHQRGTASLARLEQVLNAEPEIADRELPPHAVEVAPSLARVIPANGGSNGHGSATEAPSVIRNAAVGASIEMRNLSFAYNGKPVLRNINLTIPAGTTLAIVGPTGSGKSTLANLIPRLRDAPPGTLLFDGRSVRDIPLAELRRMIGFVPQETFLFSETLRENIAFGVESASDAEIERAAEIAGLTGDIAAFPRQYATIVGERGITLSGGQKQRTAIARAVLRQPRVLILDDALSSVDTYTEEMILTRLQAVLRGRTSILISHRVSTVRGADQIVVLEHGEIAERGTHDELLEHGTYYPELYQKQLLEDELEVE